LFKALAQYDLTKAELLMILNLRPQNSSVLDVVVEELDDRFSEETQQEILAAITEVLGRGEEEGVVTEGNVGGREEIELEVVMEEPREEKVKVER